MYLNNPGVMMLQRTLENGGTTLWTGANITMDSCVITNRAGALFQAQNAVMLVQRSGANRFDNAGTFRKSGNTGTTTLTSGVSFNNYNTVEVRNGIFAARGGCTSTANALLNSALGGAVAGTGFGQLQVGGTVNVNGSLSVDLINGFIPATNDAFAVLTAGTRAGTFANFFYPSNVVTMQLSNSPNSVVVRVTAVASPQPALVQPVISGSNVTITWTATPDTTYRVEYTTELDPPNWVALPGDVVATSNTATKGDALAVTNRFYRVRIVP